MHPAQSLYCSETTSPCELDVFLQRAKAFPSLAFALVGVDRLLLPAREALLSWTSTLFTQLSEKVPSAALGKLYLIFLRQAGVKIFSFLPIQRFSSDQLTSALDSATKQETFTPTYVRKKQGFITLQYLTASRACTGKSHTIRKRLAALHVNQLAHEPISVTICEEFLRSKFIKQYRAAIASQDEKPVDDLITLGVHLNVSCYAPFSVLARFLEQFLFWGLLEDETGQLLMVDKRVRWHFFVELATAPLDDDDFAHVVFTEQILNMLPALKHTASHQD
eukprot:TRINITY_DN7613_c0_g1_i1.p1 TRINITY_DN7613_c0_g1~~TRINITY_DN7613_c0_g1_i1.p1  ORF type:complete len:278 (-),score=29.17 TRINITY_DN7613_c0_g1_i1:79-912(-)